MKKRVLISNAKWNSLLKFEKMKSQKRLLSTVGGRQRANANIQDYAMVIECWNISISPPLFYVPIVIYQPSLRWHDLAGEEYLQEHCEARMRGRILSPSFVGCLKLQCTLASHSTGKPWGASSVCLGTAIYMWTIPVHLDLGQAKCCHRCPLFEGDVDLDVEIQTGSINLAKTKCLLYGYLCPSF